MSNNNYDDLAKGIDKSLKIYRKHNRSRSWFVRFFRWLFFVEWWKGESKCISSLESFKKLCEATPELSKSTSDFRDKLEEILRSLSKVCIPNFTEQIRTLLENFKKKNDCGSNLPKSHLEDIPVPEVKGEAIVSREDREASYKIPSDEALSIPNNITEGLLNYEEEVQGRGSSFMLCHGCGGCMTIGGVCNKVMTGTNLRNSSLFKLRPQIPAIQMRSLPERMDPWGNSIEYAN